MSLLDHPEAQALLADAVLSPEQVRGCQDRLTDFLERSAGFCRDDSPDRKLTKLEALLAGMMPDEPSAAPVLGMLLGIPLGEHYPALDLTP